MTESMDEALRRRFEELERLEASGAPPFGATWEAAEARAQRDRARRQRRAVAAVALGGLAAAAIVFLVVFPRFPDLEEPTPPEFGEPVTAVAHRAIRQAAAPSPTAFMLAPPARPAVSLDRGVTPFRYQLERVLADAETGAEP